MTGTTQIGGMSMNATRRPSSRWTAKSPAVSGVLALAVLTALVPVARTDTAIAPVDMNVQITKDTAISSDVKGHLRIVAPRGGAGSAQVVVKTSEPIVQLKGTCSDLTSKAGSKIAAGAVQVRYATRLPDVGPNNFNDFPWHLLARNQFDGLAETLVPGETVQPVWFTVNVPRDAKPGDYSGTVSLTGTGISQVLALDLNVGEFVMPQPGAQRMWMSLTQYPDAMAERYQVTQWSDAHFALIESCFRAASMVGDNVLYNPGDRALGHG